jgi:hypothetical protein
MFDLPMGANISFLVDYLSHLFQRPAPRIVVVFYLEQLERMRAMMGPPR